MPLVGRRRGRRAPARLAASGTRSGTRPAARASRDRRRPITSMCSKPRSRARASDAGPPRSGQNVDVDDAERVRGATRATPWRPSTPCPSASPCRRAGGAGRGSGRSARRPRSGVQPPSRHMNATCFGCWKSVYAKSVRPRIWPFTCAARSDARNATSGAFSAGFGSGGGASPDRSNSAAVIRGRARGRHRVHGDAVAAELERPDERHAHQRGLGRAVVGLAEVAAQPGRRRDVDDAAVALASFISGAACRAQLNEPLRCTASTASKSSSLIFTSVRSRTMPALLTRMSILPNASTAVCDDPLGAVEVGDRVVVGHGFAAERLDLLAHLRRRILFGAPPVEAHADVVDHDLGALARHAQRELARRCRGPSR